MKSEKNMSLELRYYQHFKIRMIKYRILILIKLVFVVYLKDLSVLIQI